LSLALPDSRARRRLRAARTQSVRWAVPSGAFRGLRLESFPEEALAEALDGHRAALAADSADVLKRDHRAQVSGVVAGGRRVVVKQVLKGGFARKVAYARELESRIGELEEGLARACGERDAERESLAAAEGRLQDAASREDAWRRVEEKRFFRLARKTGLL